MRIIARSTLRKFWLKHSDAEQPLKAWFDDASRSNWQSPSDIKEVYANASIIANNRVVLGASHFGKNISKRTTWQRFQPY
ncbi:MAG: hypothetical protein F6K47_40480 [Symploca sp. SIO2E6]|nr:hypothetical protein [Symploca sp. SIO2E6]